MKIFENLVHDTYRNFIAANPNAAIRADFIRDRWNNRETDYEDVGSDNEIAVLVIVSWGD